MGHSAIWEKSKMFFRIIYPLYTSLFTPIPQIRRLFYVCIFCEIFDLPAPYYPQKMFRKFMERPILLDPPSPKKWTSFMDDPLRGKVRLNPKCLEIKV